MTRRKREYPQNRGKNASSVQTSSGNHPKGRSKGSKRRENADAPLWLYGIHAVSAALSNPTRTCHRLVTTRNGLKALPATNLKAEDASPKDLDKLLPPGAVHQGVAVLTDPLPSATLEHMAPGSPQDLIVILDQVTDPHNIGAILRSCAAFGVKGLVVQSRHTPPMNGVVAKSATGSLEHIPICEVTNISRALEECIEIGYEVIGLAEEGSITLPAYKRGGPVALVLGAEGSGMRRLTKEKCDVLVSLPTSDVQSSLNVSNAAAVTLYALSI